VNPSPVNVANSAPSQKNNTVGLLTLSSYDYVYNSIGKRDPFLFIPLAVNLDDEVFRENNPLLLYDIRQLRLSAILWGISNPKALIETPDKRGYVVREGGIIGKSLARIVRIEKDRVAVAEEFRNKAGDVDVTVIYMTITPSKTKRYVGDKGQTIEEMDFFENKSNATESNTEKPAESFETIIQNSNDNVLPKEKKRNLR
jgi:type IV pilus assembly protein PilP